MRKIDKLIEKYKEWEENKPSVEKLKFRYGEENILVEIQFSQNKNILIGKDSEGANIQYVTIPFDAMKEIFDFLKKYFEDEENDKE